MRYTVPTRKEVSLRLKEYDLSSNIFSRDSLKVSLVKQIIRTKLTPAERNILLVYAELQSVRKVKDVLGSKITLTTGMVTRIRKKVKQEYEKIVTKNSKERSLGEIKGN